MTISLSDAGKRYNREWIFRHLTYNFEEGKSYAIIGPNGSGKSTLLQVISGAVHISEGSLKYESKNFEGGRDKSATTIEIRDANNEGKEKADMNVGMAGRFMGRREKSEFNPDTLYEHVSICAPYLELVEEMTLKEFFNFHSQFKPLLPGITIENIASILGLEKAANKQIRYYSSGMKQRVKLAQCIFSNVPVVLLDEPCTNLDTTGIGLYHQLINDYCKDRLVIVSSNDESEYRFCEYKINIGEYKKT